MVAPGVVTAEYPSPTGRTWPWYVCSSLVALAGICPVVVLWLWNLTSLYTPEHEFGDWRSAVYFWALPAFYVVWSGLIVRFASRRGRGPEALVGVVVTFYLLIGLALSFVP